MVLKDVRTREKLKREFEMLEKKNEVTRNSFKSHHHTLKEQIDIQSERVSKRIARFNSQNR